MRVRDFSDGCEIAQALLVRGAELAGTNGDRRLELRLGDRSGAVAGVVHGEVERAAEVCLPGRVVHVTGRCMTDEGDAPPRLVVESVREAAGGEYEPADLLDGPARDPALMEADLRALIETIQSPHLRRLLTTVLGEVWDVYREAPAAKHYHQAYRHGLLEHCLTVAQAVSATSAIFPGVDRDLAVAGALLHDIGKLEVYRSHGGDISMSDEGRLEGEIALGYYRVRRAIEELEGFPPPLAQAVTHIILSHHGTLRHGSPVVPCTREATLVHMMDNLGSRLGSFDRVERQLPAGERWSGYDKALGGGAFFPARETEAPRAA